MYIHQHKEWPHFIFDQPAILPALEAVHQQLGTLMKTIKKLTPEHRQRAFLSTLTHEIVNSTEIENESTDTLLVSSAIAHHFGKAQSESENITRSIDGMVAMVLDSTLHFFQPITENRLFGWHAGLFPSGLSGMYKITVANWRKDVEGPMEVVSETNGLERVNFQAPPASTISNEMQKFMAWYNNDDGQIDLIIKAAIAHLWFVTIHPFDDGNGRVARALTEMMLARAYKSKQRFYGMSTQLRLNRKEYCEILEKTQNGNLNITAWLQWFLDCFRKAITNAEDELSTQGPRAKN
ncbi:MAG: Fic family protein [Saprospiraceae bacterium]|nr:Fic family protein [Saprospiraceae bacterium]